MKSGQLDGRSFAVLVCVAGLLGAPAQAAEFGFSATLLLVETDTGSGRYAGALADDAFGGEFHYPDTSGPPDVLEPDEANYSFAGAGITSFASDGERPTIGPSVSVNIQNNHPLEPAEAQLFSVLLGVSVAPGTPVDVWTAAGLEAGAFFDFADRLRDGVYFEVALVSLDTSLLPGLAFRPDPPELDQVDVGVFAVLEGDAAGTVLFSALGIVDTLSPVADSDADAVPDALDNCVLASNADQRDVDGDGIGSLCDADLDNNCTVNFLDLAAMKKVFFSADENADLNASGSVSFEDLGILKSMFFGPPGPAAEPNLCSEGRRGATVRP